jgi:hypothetical protein
MRQHHSIGSEAARLVVALGLGSIAATPSGQHAIIAACDWFGQVAGHWIALALPPTASS